MTTSGYAPAPGANIYYEINGEGQPLVLVNSMLFHMALWDDMLDELARNFKVIRFDPRGLGKSDCTDLYGSDVDDVLVLLDHLGIAHAYLVGLSMGASTAFMVTFNHPDRVAALVMGASGVIGEETSEEFDARWNEFMQAAGAGERERAVDIFAELWVDGPVSPAGAETMRRAKAIMGEYDFAYFIQATKDKAAKAAAPQPEEAPATESAEQWEGPAFEARLVQMTTPILMVAGDRDYPGILNSVKETAAVIPAAEYAIIPGAAHIIPLEKPQEFTALIIDFWQRSMNAR